MGYARHIGRVGALAVTLGVGVAIVTTPGIAYAGPSDTSPSTGESPSATSPTSSPGGAGAAGANGADGVGGANGGDGADGADGGLDSDDGGVDGEGADDGDLDAGELGGDNDQELAGGGDGDGTTAGDGEGPSLDDDNADAGRGSGSGALVGQQSTTQTSGGNAISTQAGSDEDDKDFTLSDGQDSQAFNTFAVGTSAQEFSAQPTGQQDAARTLTTDIDAPAVPQPRATLVSVIADFVAAVLNPLLSPGNGSPFGLPILSAMLGAVRDELERNSLPRKTAAGSQKVTTLVTDSASLPSTLAATDTHVLVIGVDGTNLSRILDDPEGTPAFHELMGQSTNSAPSIVGHTTVSNPSWTAILTGVWGERTGVINNVFTPWTYDKYPTVFNQLETLNPEIDTMAIANWDVINGIAGAGSAPADVNYFIPQIEGDTNWLDTDDAVGAATVDAIEAEDPPNFLFTYFVGVDENGHLYGGNSEQYKLAIQNVDENLGLIMEAIDTSGEQWTVIVVTDHGHQPEKGLGHGFQSPDETATFVIARGADFEPGNINTAYEIVDTTPTVMDLFGFEARPGSDGVSLLSLGDGDHPTDLEAALRAQLAANQSPDLITNLALSLRTIFGFVPYYVYEFGNQATGAVPDFLVLPVQLVYSGLYVATNVPAQIVALLTGVSGAQLFPLLPPAPPGPFEQPPAGTMQANAILVCKMPGASACGAENAA
jgi:hypothetical protein